MPFVSDTFSAAGKAAPGEVAVVLPAPVPYDEKRLRPNAGQWALSG